MPKADDFFAFGRLMEEYPQIIRALVIAALLVTAAAMLIWR